MIAAACSWHEQHELAANEIERPEQFYERQPAMSLIASKRPLSELELFFSALLFSRRRQAGLKWEKNKPLYDAKMALILGQKR